MRDLVNSNLTELLQISDVSDLDEYRYVHFFGTRAANKNTAGVECLSQWYQKTFRMQTKNMPIIVPESFGDFMVFKNCEQYMMFCKAILFGDVENAKRIMSTANPKQCKAYGRAVRGFNNQLWLKHRVDIVQSGNYAKFSQNSDLKNFMLGYKRDVVFVEASPYDDIWGIKLAEDSPNASNPEMWRGDNLLGFILTKVHRRLTTPT